MGTRSTIALEYADGSVEQIYCHNDGYVSYNGKVLFQYYSDPFKLQKLIDLGDISVLGVDIGVKMDFDACMQYNDQNQALQCRIYGRDRDEDVNKDKFADFADYVENHEYQEYEYILRTDGKWYVKSYHFDYIEMDADLVEGAE
jgi:hypothetical protein